MGVVTTAGGYFGRPTGFASAAAHERSAWKLLQPSASPSPVRGVRLTLVYSGLAMWDYVGNTGFEGWLMVGPTL